MKIEPTKPVPPYTTNSVVAGSLDREPGFNFVTGDFNKDSRLDVAVITFTYNPVDDSFNRGTVTVYLQATNGTFPRSADYLISSRTGIRIWGDNMFAADFNEDGNLDLLTDDFGGTDMKLLLGRGDGTFQSAQALGLSVSERQITVGDVDNDGHLDILVGAAGSGVLFYRGRGTGTFALTTTLPTAGEAQCVLLAKVTSDHALDLVVTTAAGGNRRIEVFRAYDPAEFATGIVTYTTLPSFRARATEVADVNGNGQPDYIALDRNSSTVQIWFGQANGTFVHQADYFVGVDAWKVFIGDINSDGILDLMVDADGNQERPVSILLGNGDGSFQGLKQFGYGPGIAIRPRIADVNGDDRPDLLALFVQASLLPPSFDFVVGLNRGWVRDPALGFLISIEGEPGLPTTLEASSDLIDWSEVITNPGPAGTWRYIDGTSGVPYRFYRTSRPN